MKNIIIAAFCIACSSYAHADYVTLKGAEAEAFIQKYFPNAEIPGPVKGYFSYQNESGATGNGYAECFVPAMGGRSDGAVSTCSVSYAVATLTGSAADKFIFTYFPNADIPGPVRGPFTYIDKNNNQEVGYADCFVPAMGSRSEGAVSTCTVIY